MPNAFIPTRLNDLTVDVLFSGVARGDVLYRGASKWNNLAPGDAGKFLRTNGAGADPTWETVSTGLGGSTGGTDDAILVADGTGGSTVAAGGGTLTSGGVFTLSSGGQIIVPSTSAKSLAVGPNGETNPVLQVDSSDASQAGGLSVRGGSSNVVLQAISGDASAVLEIYYKGIAGATYLGSSGTAHQGLNATGMTFDSTNLIGWSSGAVNALGMGRDTSLARNAPCVVEVNNGTAGRFAKLISGYYSATTNAVANGLTIGTRTSGTAAAGLGAGMLMTIDSSTTANQSAGLIEALWETATHASRKARMVLSAYDTAVREGLRIEASGTAPMIGFLGASAVARQAFIADPSGGGTQDAEARAAIVSILDALILYGLLAAS